MDAAMVGWDLEVWIKPTGIWIQALLSGRSVTWGRQLVDSSELQYPTEPDRGEWTLLGSAWKEKTPVGSNCPSELSAQWLVTNAQTGCGEWIPGHLFWAVHGPLGLLTPTPCAEGLGNWNFPPLSALCLSSLSQPMPGAEGCPRILGPAPNHSSWHRVQSLQANTNLKQPDVLPGTTCPYQLQAPVWRVSAEEQPRTLLSCHPRTPHPWLSVLSALTLHSPQGLDEPVLPVCSRTGLMPCGPVISPKFCLITPSAHDTRRGGLVM